MCLAFPRVVAFAGLATDALTTLGSSAADMYSVYTCLFASDMLACGVWRGISSLPFGLVFSPFFLFLFFPRPPLGCGGVCLPEPTAIVTKLVPSHFLPLV